MRPLADSKQATRARRNRASLPAWQRDEGPAPPRDSARRCVGSTGRAAVSARLDTISKAAAAMSRFGDSRQPKINCRSQLTPLECGVASPADRELGLPTPAEPERVAPASASRSGPVPRVGAPRTALVTAPFLFGTIPAAARSARAPMWLFPLGLPLGE